MAFARRLTGLVLALSLFAGLPVAAARAGCVCEHGHEGSAHAALDTSAPKPHTCTSACTAATCAMHRKAASAASTSSTNRQAEQSAHGDAMRCGCAGEAQALIGQATVTGLIPATLALAVPVFARPARTFVSEAPLSLAAAPPAPPPRA